MSFSRTEALLGRRSADLGLEEARRPALQMGQRMPLDGQTQVPLDGQLQMTIRPALLYITWRSACKHWN
jgi:hypothetical protein